MPRLCVLGVLIGLVSARSLFAQPAEDVASLSRRIDELILKRAKADGVAVTGPADASTFFRRLSLDLVGKIPDLTSARDFLDNEDPHKRTVWVERYLESPRFARHFAAVYRNLLLPSSNELSSREQGGFENYLKDRFEQNIPYNKMAKEILTSPLRNNLDQGMSIAAGSGGFFAVQQGKAEDLASATSRAFLGVKLDCAQCHAHPFASWSRDQFWEFAAFFNSESSRVTPRGSGNAAPVESFKIQIPDTKKTVSAKFLDGVQPKAEGEPLNAVADWVASPKNPYFARMAADNLWAYFFGVSLLEPILEPPSDDAVVHPDLLDLLAKELIDHQFDLRFLIRAIVHTQAYQRASENPGHSQAIRYFTHMPVRGTTPEQFFDSVCEAAGYKETPGSRGVVRNFGGGVQSPRQDFLEKFEAGERRHEAQTSIQQALFLMNGSFMQELTSTKSNESLQTLVNSTKATRQKLQSLFLMTLSRLPREDERVRFESVIDAASSRDEAAQAWSNVFWALLNSAEFRLNH